MKRQPIKREKIFQVIYLIKDLYSEYIKTHNSSIKIKTNSPIKNEQKI